MLSSLKHIAVSNLSLARVARKHGFHKYILHHSPTLSQSLDRFSDIPDEDICNSNLPKAISDIFEAVAGAIFLEAGHKGETCSPNLYINTVDRIMEGLWQIHEAIHEAARYPGHFQTKP